MAPIARLLDILELQRKLLNESARLCAEIEVTLMGKLAESEKAQKGEVQ